MREQGLPYIEPVYGKHAAPMNREQAREEAIDFMTNGRRILPGWGKHRDNRPHQSRKAAA